MKRNKNKNRLKNPGSGILTVLASIWVAVDLVPIYLVVTWVFSDNSRNLLRTYFPNSVSAAIEHLTYVFNNCNIPEALKDTFIYTVIAIAIMLITASLAAYEFKFYDFPLKKLLFSVVMVSMMMPFVLYVIPLYRFVYNLGLADTYLGVAVAFMVSPLSVFILIQFSDSIPNGLVESARIDGAGHFQVYFHIVLPLMRNGLIVSSILLFLRVWGSYLWPKLVSATNVTAISATITNLIGPNFYVDARIKVAAMLVAMLPPLIVYLVFQKKVIAGIAMSGIKG